MLIPARSTSARTGDPGAVGERASVDRADDLLLPGASLVLAEDVLERRVEGHEPELDALAAEL
jgi:hypothetical protein